MGSKMKTTDKIGNMPEDYISFMTLAPVPEKILQKHQNNLYETEFLSAICQYFQAAKDEKDYEKAVEYCWDAAMEAQKEDAFLALGICFEYGIGVECDRELAKNMYNEAVKLRKQKIYELIGVKKYLKRNGKKMWDSRNSKPAGLINRKTGESDRQHISLVDSKENGKKNILNRNFKKILFSNSSRKKEKNILKIMRIVFSNEISESAFSHYYKDISENCDGTVIGWIEDTILHIQGNGNIAAPADCSYLFSQMSNLETIEFNNVFKIKDVKFMNDMFSFCKNLRSLDLSGFDTGNVITMNSMFENCKNLEKLDLSYFKTRNVTTMRKMFCGCENLINLDLSGFDFWNIFDMESMFRDCKKLEYIDLGKLKKMDYVNMNNMFSGCIALPEKYKQNLC